ncbi:uncharacterized protein LOC141600701 [Silene latifolia]|uniref:uncharacterized protein LOC141600701 n=1 Tax=Silene latifolia TaxID=37657 RepID=UPI003D777D16
MNVFCWNCRGFGETDDPTIPYISHCIHKYHPSILFLQETHTSVGTAALRTSNQDLPNFCGVDSLGRSGGLLLRWADSVDISVICSDPHFIFCNLSVEVSPSMMQTMYCMFIYGEPVFMYRSSLWDKISDVILGYSPFVIIGDFNQVELHSDKLGGSSSIRGQDVFTNWKLHNNLIDVPFFGPRFTWSNSQHYSDCIMERLDRAYATADWFNLFPFASVTHLQILISDHAQIILRLTQPAHSKRPYRLDNWCLSLPEVNDLVTSAWATPVRGSTIFMVSRKLAAVRFALLKWVVQHRVSYGINWSSVENDLDHSSSSISDTFSADAFHSLRADRDWLHDPLAIEAEIIQYFRDLFLNPVSTSQSQSSDMYDSILSNLELPSLLQSACSLLSAPYLEGDVIRALRNMNGSKSPGPDGITPRFCQLFWSKIGHLVTSAILLFLNSGVMLKEWNSTLLVLTPKIDHPEMVSHYRPISLCNVIYRIASKCLANRLKLVIPLLSRIHNKLLYLED